MINYEILINGEVSNTSTYDDYARMSCNSDELQGTECGCCGNYEGQCYYANCLCLIHDFICQNCDAYYEGYNICGPGCKPTPCTLW